MYPSLPSGGCPSRQDLLAMAVEAVPPETRYAGVGNGNVAYQVMGQRSPDLPDLLHCFGLSSHIDLSWDLPGVPELWRRMATFCRPIAFDRRGTGASDAVPFQAMPTWEQWSEDIGAVLDAVGSTEAVLAAELDAGPFAVLYSAMHPERVKGLVLSNTAARFPRADDYPFGFTTEEIDAFVELVSTFWGTPQMAVFGNPSLSIDDERSRISARTMRASATPRAAAAQYEYILRNLDVRQALASIQAPTLILHTTDNRVVPIELSQYLADHIDRATFIELPGTDLSGANSDFQGIDAIAEFLTGQRIPAAIDRVLTTVLFTDIANSTAMAAAMGDRRWRSLLDTHDHAVREQLRRFRGKEINTTGDGFVVSFDGPARAIRCGQAILEATRPLGIEVRAGLHTGECEVRGDDLGGLAVHIAARVGALAHPGAVLVSSTVKDLVVGSGIEFNDWGEQELKGVPGSWKLFAVRG
jgi:class 3 adenylate cyclase/pimeloyl-ACP methyl ester carboxylesterase